MSYKISYFFHSFTTPYFQYRFKVFHRNKFHGDFHWYWVDLTQMTSQSQTSVSRHQVKKTKGFPKRTLSFRLRYHPPSSLLCLFYHWKCRRYVSRKIKAKACVCHSTFTPRPPSSSLRHFVRSMTLRRSSTERWTHPWSRCPLEMRRYQTWKSPSISLLPLSWYFYVLFNQL